MCKPSTGLSTKLTSMESAQYLSRYSNSNPKFNSASSGIHPAAADTRYCPPDSRASAPIASSDCGAFDVNA